jgi:ribose transport system ATP-binding protein
VSEGGHVGIAGDPPGSPASAVSLRVEDLTVAFPGQLALDGVTLSLNGGEITALMGQNGSGKSTLIKVLAGLYSPAPGASVQVGDEVLDLGSPASSQRLGLRFVHQELGLIDDLSAMENIALSAGYVTNRLGKIRWSAEQERAQVLLARLGSRFDVREPISRRTAVERTAIAVARALWDWEDVNNGLLVLDEPTATMPPDEVDRLFEIIRNVRDRGAAVLYVSHRLDEIFEIGDRVLVLREGALVGNEPVSGVTEASLTRMMLGRDSDNAPVAVSKHRARSDVVLSLRSIEVGHGRALDLEIARGEIVGVTGLEGSGRDQLPYAVADRVRASRQTEMDDVIPARIGVVPVDRARAGSIPSFTVRENFALVGGARFRRAGILRKRLETRALEEWARKLDLMYQSPEQRFSTLSGGNQQKVILARWLSMQPALMVIDEPTHGVDIGARAAIHEAVRSFAREGLAFLLCSSDIPDLMAVCTRILVVRRGRIVAECDQAEFDEHSIMASMMGGGVAA